MFDAQVEEARIANASGLIGIARNAREYARFVDRATRSLSKSIWDTVNHTEEAILNTVRGSVSQGRDVRSAAADIMAYGRFGPQIMPGRWGKLEPGTKPYARRLGKAGIDYRVIRLRRSEQYRMLQERAIAEGQRNPACTGEYDWIRFNAGDPFDCGICEDLAAGGPYAYDTVPAYPHPNCMCEVRPRIKGRNEFNKELRAYANGESEGSGIARWAQENNLAEPSSGASVESRLGISREEPAGMMRAVRAANASAGNSAGFLNNCQRSVVAYELQRCGFRVTAMPAIKPRSRDIVNAGNECFVGSQFTRGGRGWSDLSEKLRRHPMGSRFAVVWNWKGGGGHAITAERTRGGVRFFEAQEGVEISALPSIQRIQITNGRRDLFYYRMDNLPLNYNIDFSKIVSPHAAGRRVDNADTSGIIYKQEKAMTREDALEILKKSDKLTPHTNEDDDDRETWHYAVGEFYKEAPDAFGFAVYPYSSQTPIDPLFAFAYWVLKESGEVSHGTYPISPDKLKKMAPPAREK